jgi:hypothetical protein
LRKAVDAATAFCAERQVILPAIEQIPAGSPERLQRIDDAVPERTGFRPRLNGTFNPESAKRLNRLLKIISLVGWVSSVR